MYIKFLIILLVLISIIFLTKYAYKKKEGLNNKPKYLNGIDVIYWINLDRSQDRRQKMEKMFEDPVFKGKKIVRISAVDGKASNIDQILNASFEGMKPDNFTKVEYACLLSHLNAIREFSKSNDETALIMEDDTTLEYKPYWKKSVKQIMENAPSDWEIIQLCINTHTIPQKIYTKQNGNTYFSTGAYIINKNGAKSIINQSDKHGLNQNIGHSADVYLYLITNTYTYKYPYFTYTYDETSTIHQLHVKNHNIAKKIIDGFIQSSHYQ